jgi:hypothetical protein
VSATEERAAGRRRSSKGGDDASDDDGDDAREGMGALSGAQMKQEDEGGEGMDFDFENSDDEKDGKIVGLAGRLGRGPSAILPLQSPSYGESL